MVKLSAVQVDRMMSKDVPNTDLLKYRETPIYLFIVQYILLKNVAVRFMNKIGNIEGKNILLLQGPMGSFFRRLDLVFRKRGARTFKIGFNAGDSFFSNRDNYTPYRKKPEQWESNIQHFLKDRKIDMIFLFGDCRFYQKIAIDQSLKLGINVFVFEEGYLRPDFITLERYGVNNFSKISRDPYFYRNLDREELDSRDIVNTYPKYYRKGWSATTYYTFSGLLWFLYPHYHHHRHFNFIAEALWGVRNAFRKYKYRITERNLLKTIVEEYGNTYYFVPLQTHNDFQLTEHSDFPSIESFIERVIHSFAKHAPRNTILIIKHHPEDRGRKNYRKLIDTLGQKLGIKERVITIYDLHLPTCLVNAIGTVTINSTVGISSLLHGRPTITLGKAIYDIEGLTCRKMSLDNFWTQYTPPDQELFEKFRRYLIETTQLNGSFYGKFPEELQNPQGG